VPSHIPPRRWCREVLRLQQTAAELLAAGTALTDPQIVRLSRRLDRLVLDAQPRPAEPVRP
jgi:hypothetical protein